MLMKAQKNGIEQIAINKDNCLLCLGFLSKLTTL